ncbi:ethanolamine transporter [Breznakia blatticola]|uniref:Ethanolamine transporter n=1 Tax=Breznakia blatticola TaxID=1754012 RepID=A0A4R8A5T5_9FIRM|nr:ethanolamine utilization protein EutH [Breznakia blatticola]TDW25742.1 ethanolamine transporter [Breznakia blatticola]
MEFIGKIVIYIIMFCAFLGAISSLRKDENLLGLEFVKGIESIGTIFLSVGGVMASIPILTKLITSIISPLYQMVGADSAMAATTFLAVDMGGYQLADVLSDTRESWIMAMVAGYMAGATIVFTIPVALRILKKEDHKFLAYGVLAGFVSIPIGVLVSSLSMVITNPLIRDVVSTSSSLNYQLQLSIVVMIRNLLPLLVVCAIIVVGLIKVPNTMIQGFQMFGNMFNAIMRMIFVICVIEHFTSIFSNICIWLDIPWLLDPMIADTSNINRALENAGYIGIMLCGTFPMMYLIKKYFIKHIIKVGDAFGLSDKLMVGLIGCCANVLASLVLVEDLDDEDKVIVLAFSVCGSFLLGDHLAFTTNYQPSLVMYIILGKLVAGICAIIIAKKAIIPIMKKEIM